MELRINSTEYTRMLLDTVLSRRPPRLDELEKIAGRVSPNTLVAVCATPKSGSTFLTNVLMQALSRPFVPLCYAYSSNEHDLYLPALVAATLAGGAVSQLHVKATPHNVELFDLFGIRPIVLTRNIYDAVESLARDLRRKQAHSDFGTGRVGYSFAWLDHNLADASEERLFDFVIDMALPWYVNFHVSWSRLAAQGQIDPLWITYEELMDDPRARVRDILTALGFDPSLLREDLLQQDYLRDNPGIGRGSGASGRGLEKLSARQVQRVQRLLSHYPDVDFAGFGV